ncbi:B12-binding domain-containing radical SAM protein [Faecalicatena sp. AGMB00832]|uniref:B12-binding domain-containing radical SAM protein n=1 Tax=Faecalicatena faecalis TaxID=2726362 RepID=A0ABS6D2T7_9FIRM|nr:B12-binding domain-containing radical SAM protein [Faecalicatena faecalis]MBU3875914.1 B12-binding domain-containing radical SAM protein [Faecalicatena faecalis]
MKVLLTAINAKYIHSNLAVYSLKSYASVYAHEVEIAEYTINQNVDDILSDIYKKAPDILCFSCYLWNITYINQLIVEIKKILPDVHIWLGGPEVSYNAVRVLNTYPQASGVMCGEGEETFLELLDFYHGKIRNLKDIKGITFRMWKTSPDSADNVENKSIKNERTDYDIVENPWRKVMDLNKVPFVYDDMEKFRNKIIYYESSRGCPFSCSYCLSSIDKCLRFRDLKLVKKELQVFIDAEVPQVKFVDRTFNCKHEHAMEIWSYLAEHDKGKTNFHFEVSADLLNEEELCLIESMRPGLIQLEIGVQSTNPDTIKEIHRTMKFDEVRRIVERIHKKGNVHQHLDLIAGLPFEDYASFQNSFNDVYSLHPEQLQLGFLKVLKGSYMHENAVKYGLQYQERPPFEVLSTKWLPYSDIIRLKGVEEMVEVYYNSGQFIYTLRELERHFSDAFSLYEELGRYYERNQLHMLNHSRITRYEILFRFAVEYDGENEEIYKNTLTVDLYLRDNVKNRPDFAGEETVGKEEAAKFYDMEAREHRYLQGYEQFDKRQLRKMTHLEKIDGKLLLFDYQNRNVLTNQAMLIYI